MSFRIGDKVVCVDDDFTESKHFKAIPSRWPKKGVIYYVRHVDYISPRPPWPEGWGIWLVGIIGDIHPVSGIEVGFSASRFRLLSEVGHPPIQLSRDCTVEA